jgi:hypothetical protein
MHQSVQIYKKHTQTVLHTGNFLHYSNFRDMNDKNKAAHDETDMR